MKAPGAALFTRLREVLGELPFIAEDLGLITPEVDEMRKQFEMPGMCILQFGFGSRSAHNYLPHKYVTNTVAYTGTHDNDTTRGWWENGANEVERAAVSAYLEPGPEGVVWPMIRAAATSVADICLFPVQDVLNLGSEARMNTPSQPEANWSWRCPENVFSDELANRLSGITVMSDRDLVIEEQSDGGDSGS